MRFLHKKNHYVESNKVLQKAKCIVDYKFYTHSIRGVSKNQGVPKSTVHRWIQQDKVLNGIVKKRKEYKKR